MGPRSMLTQTEAEGLDPASGDMMLSPPSVHQAQRASACGAATQLYLEGGLASAQLNGGCSRESPNSPRNCHECTGHCTASSLTIASRLWPSRSISRCTCSPTL